MIQAAFVLLYLAGALYIGIFAFGKSRGDSAEDFFLAGRSIGSFVFVLSLFGTHMTAFSILGASGYAFANGVVTYGLMASSSALIVPITLYFLGTRLWSLGKRHGFMTHVQMFRDRWECGHTGTLIFVVQAALLVPYIIIGVIGGGTTLEVLSGGAVPYWAGGALVAVVVMSYVFFGGMRGTAWVNTFQTVLFLVFGLIAAGVIGEGMGGFAAVMERLAGSPSTAPLLTHERVAPLYYISYMFIPLSAIAFPHIGIFCFTARRAKQFKYTMIFYPLCILAVWVPSVYLGVAANGATDVPEIQRKIEARTELAQAGPDMAPETRQALTVQARGDDVIVLLLNRYAALWLAGILGAGILAAVMASDSQILALSTMFTEDVFAYYGGKKRFGERAQVMIGRAFVIVLTGGGLCDRPRGASVDLRPRHTVCVHRVRGTGSAADRGSLLARQHEVGSAGEHDLGGIRSDRHRGVPTHRCRAGRRTDRRLVFRWTGRARANRGRNRYARLPAGRAGNDHLDCASDRRIGAHAEAFPSDDRTLFPEPKARLM